MSNSLPNNIYYAQEEILDKIKADFNLIDDKDWHQLYQHKTDNTFWRLDKWDKYQTQFFVRIETLSNWVSFDDKELRIVLLLNTRGTSNEKCSWGNCNKSSLHGLAYCERHAYEEMGIRK